MLDTAMDIIVEGGMEALTIARLAERLDAAVGALYRYFPGKQALIVALQHQCLEQYLEVLTRDLHNANTFLDQQPDKEVSPGVRYLMLLLTLSYSYILDSAHSPTRHRLMDILISTPDPLLSDDEAKEVDITLRKILEKATRLMIDAENVGALQGAPDLFASASQDEDASPEAETVRRAWQRAHVLWAHLHGLDHFRKRDRIQAPALQVETLFYVGLQTLFQGWGAETEALKEAFALFATFVVSWKSNTLG